MRWLAQGLSWLLDLPFFGACVLLCRLGMSCANGPHILRPQIFDGRTMTKKQHLDELFEKGKPKQAKQALKTGEVSCGLGTGGNGHVCVLVISGARFQTNKQYNYFGSATLCPLFACKFSYFLIASALTFFSRATVREGF